MSRSSSLVLVLLVLASAAVPAALGDASKLRTLRFYLHDVDANPSFRNATNVIAASPRGCNFTTFGSIFVIDDPLTQGPSLDSKLIGRARGILATDSLVAAGKNLGLFFSFTAVLENGNTLVLQGQDITSFVVQEIAVVGGTGLYRFARGYARLTFHEWSLGAYAVLKLEVFFKVG